MVNKLKAIKLTAVFSMLLSLASLGCASRCGILGVDACADIPAGAVPAPVGAKVCAWQTAQVSNAVADQTILYNADFIGLSDQLSPAAIERLARNADSGLVITVPSFVEPSGDAALDAARVNAVMVQLASHGVTEPIVEVATPAALGLRGPQAERVAGGFANTRGSSVGTGAPISRPSGLGGQAAGFGGLQGGIL
ncbi:MAG: hypothetical protein R3C05_18725 [Pirellulaceae bacterium]